MAITQVATLIIDIGLGAMAYWMARAARIDIANIKLEVKYLNEKVKHLMTAVF